MTDVISRPSPCPVCESGGTTAWHEEGWQRIQAYCSECGLAGPYAKTTDAAAELWSYLSYENNNHDWVFFDGVWTCRECAEDWADMDPPNVPCVKKLWAQRIKK